MKTIKQLAIMIATIIWAAASLNAQNPNSQGAQQALQKEYYGQQAQQKIPGASFIKDGTGTSFPSFVRFDETKKIRSAEFIPWLKSTMKTSARVDFKIFKQENDELGFTHERHQQTVKGIPVENATYTVHVKDGNVKYFNGIAVEIPEALSPTPVLSESAALDAAKRFIGADSYKWEVPFWENEIKERTKNPDASYFPKGLLCWYSADINVQGKTPVFRLAYRFDIDAASPTRAGRIYIDAMTGTMLSSVPLESNCTATNVNTNFNGNRGISTDKYTATNYRMRDDCQAAAIWIRDWNSNNCTANPLEIENTTNTWNNTNDETFAGTVLWSTKQAYLYWLNVRSRNSYDNANGSVTGYINAWFSVACSPQPCCVTPNQNNASMSFTGGTLKVGLGGAGTLADSWSALDILGHEYTHAVTGSSAALTYSNESGALNESFSDIFGEALEQYVLGNMDWFEGAARSSGPIRSLKNPTNDTNNVGNAFNDPDTYLSPANWFTGTADNGGVHTNSGVQNFWFYLLSVGGSGTNDIGSNYSVTGIGPLKAATIAARNLLTQLNSASQYSDARAGAIQAAIDLYGSCSNEVKQTTNAWYAVGVGARFFDANPTVTSNYNGSEVSCHDACDGSAAANVISGFGELYNWSNGASTANIAGLCPGTYTVTVTNFLGFGCAVTKSVTINNPPELVLPALTLSSHNGYNISCSGGSDGTATAIPSGGTGTKSYSWSNGQTGSTAINLSAGTYTVTVTDVNGCSATRSATLTQPPPVNTMVAPTTNYNGFNVRCHGGSDGAAAASPSGGVGSFTFSWSNGATTNPATGLSAGTYTVTVTDANGCSKTASTTLTEPPQLTIDAGPNKIVYYGYPDSACARLQSSGAGGGVPPRTLTWSTGSHAAFINVCPTTTTVYYLTITDANNCSVTDSVKVCVFDVRCGNNMDNVIMCHGTGSLLNPFITLCIDRKGAKYHFVNHVGDQLAACGTIKVCTFPLESSRLDGQDDNIISDDVYLGAFPNPFSDVTTVRFKLPFNEYASLKIYDLAGREITTLFEGEVMSGSIFETYLDGAQLAEGMYLLSLRTVSGEKIVRKLMLSK